MTLAIQRSVPEATNYDDQWNMVELTSRFPLIKGLAEASINGTMLMYDSGGMGGMLGLGY